MATRDGEVISELSPFDSVPFHGRDGEYLAVAASAPVEYIMIGTDALLSTQDTWPVTGSPDPTGAQYEGSLATPLRFVSILEKNE